MKKRAGVSIVVLPLALAPLGGGELLPHEPISILSDEEFTAENGVIADNGTMDTPYVVAGWTIAAGSSVGIRIQGTSAHVLVCDLGLALVHTSARNVVVHNLFVGNARAATCDEADNRWDDGYPSGGNYWGEDGAADVRSGPSQDRPGSVGIRWSFPRQRTERSRTTMGRR